MIRPEREFTIALRDGVSTTVRDLGRGPNVLFSHGTGYACDAFAPFVHALAGRCRVFCVDLRGHGIGPPVNPQDFSLALLVSDLHDTVAALKRDHGVDALHGVFHSIAAVLALRVQADRADAFRSIVGFEPPLAAIGADAAAFREGAARMATRALRRRRTFSSARELADRYRESGTLAAGGDEAALALAEGVLDDAVDGRRALRCAPEIEAKVYAGNTDMGIWQALGTIGCPGMIVRGQHPSAAEYTEIVAAHIAEAAGFDLRTLAEGVGHLGWIEEPERGAELVAAYVCGQVVNRGATTA